MTAPIKTCDYCDATGEMPTFMNGETICYTCMSVLPKTLPEARQELMRLRAVLAVGAQPAPSVPDGWETDLLIVEHAMRMNNWDWNSDTSDDLKRSAYKIISKLLAAPEAKP